MTPKAYSAEHTRDAKKVRCSALVFCLAVLPSCLFELLLPGMFGALGGHGII